MNPLAELFDVEERSDGVYIKVTRTQKDTIHIGSIENELKSAYVMNYDIKSIQDVFLRARGVFERIGSPFEYYEIKFDTFLYVEANPLKATMRISSKALVEGIKPSVELVCYGLKRQGIKFGIKKEAIVDMISKSTFDTDIEVAVGTPAEQGVDAKIEMEVKIDPDATPKIDKNGRTDYRNIKTFTTIREGQIIARRYPPKPGKPGCSVYGEPIESKEGMDIGLPSGKNTEITDNGVILRSLKTGVVYKYEGLIHVRELLDIPKNVDFSVGNIKYTGDVIIRGNVKPGFTIESEGDISINGEVESATVISRQGFVQILKGVIGKGETQINAEKGLSVTFAQEVNLKTNGILTVEKHLLHCQGKCSILCGSSNSNIIGGDIDVYNYAEINNIGNDKHVKTKINLVDLEKEKVKEKIKELKTFQEKVVKSLEPVKRELKSKSIILKQAGNTATDRQKQELKKWLDNYNNLTMKIKYIDSKIVEMNNILKNPSFYKGYIKVRGIIFPGVTINLYDQDQKVIETKLVKKTLSIKNNVINIESDEE